MDATITNATSDPLVRLELSKVPIGLMSVNMTVGDTRKKIPLMPYWISFSLVNDGPGGLSVGVNDQLDCFFVNPMVSSSEALSIDMIWPVVESLHFKAEDGTEATVRCIGKQGRWRL